jgi:hypothetical protein
LTIDSEETDGDSTDNTLLLPGRKPAYVTIADFLASSPRQSSISPSDSLMVEVTKGAEHTWYSVEAGWSGYQQFQLQLSAAGDQVVMTATAAGGQQYRATLPLTNAAVKTMGIAGDARLLRIDGSREQLGMTPVTAAAAAQAEGEAPVFARLAAPSSEYSAPINDAPTLSAEGESWSSEAEGEAPEAAISVSYTPPGGEVLATTSNSAAESLVAGLWAPPAVVSTIDVQTAPETLSGGTPTAQDSTAADDAQRVDAILASNEWADEIADPEFVLLASQDRSDDYAQAVDTVLAAEAL